VAYGNLARERFVEVARDRSPVNRANSAVAPAFRLRARQTNEPMRCDHCRGRAAPRPRGHVRRHRRRRAPRSRALSSNSVDRLDAVL